MAGFLKINIIQLKYERGHVQEKTKFRSKVDKAGRIRKMGPVDEGATLSWV